LNFTLGPFLLLLRRYTKSPRTHPYTYSYTCTQTPSVQAYYVHKNSPSPLTRTGKLCSSRDPEGPQAQAWARHGTGRTVWKTTNVGSEGPSHKHFISFISNPRHIAHWLARAPRLQPAPARCWTDTSWKRVNEYGKLPSTMGREIVRVLSETRQHPTPRIRY
jgi:hypothetical protein